MAKELSDEQKQARLDNLAKAREAKQAKSAQTQTQPQQPQPQQTTQPDPQPTPQADPRDSLIAQLIDRVAALEAQGQGQATPEEKMAQLGSLLGNRTPDATVGPRGVQGIVRKYNIAKWEVDKTYFPDPTDRLYDEPELRRFAMRENYKIEWEVQGFSYEDKHGVSYSEPQFTVHLKRYPYEGEELPANFPKNGLILVKRMILHEDEFVARKAADELGLQFADDEQGFKKMMDEMRYFRIRQWLIEHFKPEKMQRVKKQTRPMAIGGTILEVEDGEKVTDVQGATTEAERITKETRLTQEEREALGVDG